MKSLIRKLTAWAWKREISVCEGIAKVKSLSLHEKGMEIEIENNPETARWVGTCFASLVANSTNYTEMQFKLRGEYKGKFEFMTVLIQKHNGKSPHQLRQEAEAECERLRKLLEEAK